MKFLLVINILQVMLIKGANQLELSNFLTILSFNSNSKPIRFRVLEKEVDKLTKKQKQTMLNINTNRKKDDICSLYNFVSRAGKVPVISGSSTQAT